MPKIPAGISPFSIGVPLTSGDYGEASSSVVQDVNRVFDFISDERHLTAQNLYESIIQRLKDWEEQQTSESATTGSKKGQGKRSLKSSIGKTFALSGNKKQREQEEREAELLATKDAECNQAKQLMEQNQQKLEVLQNRCRLFRKAQKSLTETDAWTLAAQNFGIDTYYRREDDGTLSLKLEGEMKEIPLFEQVAVLREVDLHCKWAPFCSSSMTVADLDKLDTVGWFMVGLSSFGLARDGCFRAIGCDNIHEDGSILLAGQGIRDVKPGAPQPTDTFLCNDPVIEKLPIPPIPSRRGAGRMTIRTFDAIIHVTSPASAVLKIVANIDPNISFLPQSLLEFIMKQMCGILLAKMQSAAKKIVMNPATNEHAQRMREEEEFYRGWLMAKFEAVCKLKGWQMPVVKAFALSDEELRQEQKKRPRKNEDTARRSFPVSGASRSSTDGPPIVGDSVEFKKNGEDIVREDDLVSELTNRSDVSWNGPLRTFVRRREEKRAQRKVKQIKEVRHHAARRIQPRERSPSKAERLEQLRDAKARRVLKEGTWSAIDDDSESGEDKGGLNEVVSMSFSERITDRLRSHGSRKRVFVMVLCLSLFFVLVRPELLELLENFSLDLVSQTMGGSSLGTNSVDSSETTVNQSASSITSSRYWWVHLSRGAGFLFHMLLCTILHFATCDIALVYAYDSLELGTKTGRTVRKYYSEHVRVMVAGMSLGIFFVSLCKAMLRIVLSYIMDGNFTGYLSQLDLLTSESRALSGQLTLSPNATANATGAQMNYSLPGTTTSVSSEESWNGGLFTALIGKIRTSEAATSALIYFVSQLNVVGFEEAVVSWREDALETARQCYSYTLIPLVIFLVLFNYSVIKLDGKSSDDANKSYGTETTVSTTVTSPQRFETSDDEENIAESVLAATEVSPNADLFGKPPRKRRIRGYFRRRAYTAGALDSVQEDLGEEEELQRQNTM